MSVLKILDTYSDFEQEIYLKQQEKLKEGIILKTIHDLKENPRNIFKLDHLFFSQFFSLRGEIYSSKRILFEDDKIEITRIDEQTYKIKLLNPGWSRTKCEAQSFIFDTHSAVKKHWREVMLHELVNIDLLTMSFALYNDLFHDWGLITEGNHDFFLKLKNIHEVMDQKRYLAENETLKEITDHYASVREDFPVYLEDAVFYALGLNGLHQKALIEKKMKDSVEFWEQKEIVILDL